MTRRNGAVDAAVRELRANPRLTIADAARKHDCPRKTVSDALNRAGGRADAPDIGPDKASFSGDSDDTVAALLKKQGLDPSEWEVVRLRTGEWGSDENPNAQVRFDAVPKALLNLDLAAEPREPLPPPSPPTTADRSLLFVGDHHAPHQDPGMHRALCSYLSDQRPSFCGLLGDMGDYASISRHRPSDGFRQGVRTCNQGVYDILHDYRASSPDTEFVLLPGNHDARIEFYVQDNAERIMNIGPAYQEDVPMYDLRRLWRLDELGIELVHGTWETAKYKVTPSLTIRHGYQVAKGNGQTMLNKHGSSGIQGHDHTLKFTYKTKHDPLDIRVAISAGCACIVDEEGLGYTPEPDWQQGCIVGHAWENGDFALAPVPYVHGSLLCPDGRRFSA